jgi:hypothetical protein
MKSADAGGGGYRGRNGQRADGYAANGASAG